MLIENIRLAFSGLRSNLLRSILTMLGIIIGIGSVIGIMTVGNSLSSSVSDSMSSLGTNNVSVSITRKSSSSTERNSSGFNFGNIGRQAQVSEDDYYSVEMINDIIDVFSDYISAVQVSESIGSGTAGVGSATGSVNVSGVNLGYFVMNNMDLLAGNIFSEDDFNLGSNVALIADDLCEDLFGTNYENAIGQTIEVNYNSKYVNYVVCGVYDFDESSSFSMDSSSITTSMYVPLLTAQNENHNYKYSSLTFLTKNVDDYEAFCDEMTDYINTRYYHNNDDYEANVYSMSSMVETLTNMLSTITLAISVIAGISLLVGGIGVMNIMLVSVSERTNEIGTRKALGATNGNIKSQFIVESVILCLIGGAIGVVLGITIGAVGSKIMGYAATISYSAIVISLVFSMSIGVFFGYYPAKKAAQMNPIDALRY